MAVLRGDHDLGTFVRGPLDHPFARVEADHLGAPGHELFGVDARPAAGVEHPLAPNVPEQRERRGTLIVGVVRLGGDAGRVGVRQLS